MELLGFLRLGATVVGTGIALAGTLLRQANRREARFDARLDQLEVQLNIRREQLET